MTMGNLLGAVAVAACALFGATVTASATTYIVEQSQSRYISCYRKVYVPARIEVNTRGVLVRAASREWEVNGDTWASTFAIRLSSSKPAVSWSPITSRWLRPIVRSPASAIEAMLAGAAPLAIIARAAEGRPA